MLEFLEKKLKQIDNRARLISSVISGDITVISRKQKELLQEFAEKGFDPLPKEKPPVAAVGTSAEEEGNETSPSEDGTGYEYLMSMMIPAFNDEYLDHLAELKKRLQTKVGLLRKATPQCLKSRKEPSLLDDYKKAISGRKFMINFAAQDGKVLKVKAAPRRQNKRTAAESIETGGVLMDHDEDHLAGCLTSQEDSETESTQKQQRKKQRKQRKRRRKEESKTGAIPCRALDSRGHDRSNQGFLTEEIRKIASGLDGVKITHGNGNRDQNRVAHDLAKLSLRDGSVSF